MGVMQWTKVPKAVWVEVPVIHEDAKYCKKGKKIRWILQSHKTFPEEDSFVGQ